MTRPAGNIELALLASGRALYAVGGSAGVSIRALAEHAGVSPGLFHYHFTSKEAFLRQLLDAIYEELYTPLTRHAQQDGPAIQRLRQSLLHFAGFVRDHNVFLGRLLVDAGGGDAVAADFLRDNAPRHVTLLVALMQEAEADGDLLVLAPLQRFVFVMGAVGMPLLVAPRLADLGVAPGLMGPAVAREVMSDEGIAQRVDLALGALREGRA